MTSQADLQAQIVELRLRLDQLAEGQAALIEHVTRREVQHALRDAVPTPDELRELREMLRQRSRRRELLHDVAVHLAKWGAGGVVGFVFYSVWERLKKEGPP
jgi:hypothetical protein